jgi:glyoxylase-like metal-dependent hydrolase (beta-lactamase superfamily II)
MTEYTIHPLVVGINETDQGVMTYLRGYGRRIYLPIYVFYLEGGREKILVDTGLEQFMVPPGVEEKCGFKVLEFEPALASVGLKPSDIDVIIHTHLHNDHCENDYKCQRARVYAQQAELDFLKSPHPLDHRYFPDILEGVNVVPVQGDAEIVDGVKVILTPGHSPGGQSVLVNTAKGKALITGFCCNAENFPKEGGVVCPGVHLDAIAAYESAKRARGLADILIPLHDLSVGAKKTIP